MTVFFSPGLRCSCHMVRADRLPAVGNGIDGLALFHSEPGCPIHDRLPGSLPLGVKASERFGAGKIGKVIAPLAIFGLMIDHSILDLHLSGVEIALEIRRVILGIPQTKFDAGKHRKSAVGCAGW